MPAAPVPGSAGRVREFFTRLAGTLALDPVPLDPAGSALADAVVAVAAVGVAARAAGRDGHGVGVGAGGRAHVRVAAVPGRPFRACRGRPGGVCPGLTVQRGLAPAAGLSRAVTLGEPACAGGERGRA